MVSLRRAVLGVFPLLIGASSCREVPTTQLLVVVDTNLAQSDGLTEVRIEVQSPDGTLQQERGFDLAPSGRVQFPFSFGVVPRGADEGRRVRVIAEARNASGETVVRRSALCGFFPDTILRLPLFLPDICRGLQCPPGTTCRGDARECVPDEVDLNRLERITARTGAEFDGSVSLPFSDASTAEASASDARSDVSDDRSIAGDAGADVPAMDAGADVPAMDAGADVPAMDAGADVVARDVVASDADAGFLAIPTGCAYPSATPDARATVSTAAPRLVAPLSLGTVTSLRPTLRWVRPSGADAVRVELCEDRACARPLGSFMSAADAQQVPSALAPGRVVFWRALPMSGGAVSGPASPVWYFRTPRADLGVDTSWGAQTDLNGDGVADVGLLAVSSSGLRNTLAVALYHGGPTGVCFTPQAQTSFSGAMSGEVDITAAGDFDGDGFADLAYSSTASGSTSGQVFVRWGGPTGLTAVGAQTLGTPSGDLGFGFRVRAIGDVNRDGYADLAVTVTGVTGMTTAGGVRVFLGGAGGVRSPAAHVIPGAPGDQLGLDVVGGGADFDGDGFHDLVAVRRSAAGGFVLARGGPTGLGAPEARPAPIADRQSQATALAAADLNGDGRSDLVYLTGSTGTISQGVLATWGGVATGLPMAPGWTFPTPSGTDFLPAVRAGESSGDTAAEVLLIERRTSGTSTVLQPKVLLGRVGAVELTASPAVIDVSEAQGFSPFLGFSGDTDGDGFGDFSLGTPFVRAYGYGGFGVLRGGASGWAAGGARFVPLGVGTLGRTQLNQVFQ